MKNLINAWGPINVDVFVSFIYLCNEDFEQVFW